MYYKSYGKNIIFIFNIHVCRGMKAAQMLASTVASVNLTLYDDKFGLQGYYYSKT